MGKLSDILGDKVLADAKTTFNVANLELTCSVLGSLQESDGKLVRIERRRFGY
eukprot:m.68076 g.68076  ORF g.68076 m.68076 type:complete len:53 (-) comp19862_c0_seq2:30-188(-)